MDTIVKRGYSLDYRQIPMLQWHATVAMRGMKESNNT